MTAILGLSALYHDSAAALVVDGRIVAAAQEERFTRTKHDAALPERAIAYCLGEAGLSPGDIEYVAFYEKPLLKFDRLIETYLAYAPRGFGSFAKAMPEWLRDKLFVPRRIAGALGGAYRRRVVFAEHHVSHAASAFLPSPFDEAAILTIDGVGEWATASYGVGRGNRVTLTHEQHFPHSLGLLYSAFTYYCGFRVNSGEYKLMGLAPYGEPRYADLIREHLVDIRPDGSIWMDMSYFNYCQGLTMTGPRFHALFGGPPRRPDDEVTQRDMDLAASIQVVTEEIVLRAARHVHAETGCRDLCLAGGVALNCVANGRLLREGPFERIWIQPAAGDAGGALGAALFVWHDLLDQPRDTAGGDRMAGAFLGPRYADDEVRAALDAAGARYHEFADEAALVDRVAGLLADEQVVGWCQGRMEFGPRALGGRSILGDARSPRLQSVMNLKIKFRESFRPFAPAVLQESTADYFDWPPSVESPYMLVVAPVAAAARVEPVPGDQASGLARLHQVRSTIPAVTHVDYSARVQTVDAARHGRFHALLAAFARLTGSPVLINTSFNVRGEPIVNSPADAFRCFMATDMDALVFERCVMLKGEQDPALASRASAYLASVGTD
ncbi:MAG: carbamoyltransferase [Vicinamibacterales bacterium]